jgi:hypothetical protein
LRQSQPTRDAAFFGIRDELLDVAFGASVIAALSLIMNYQPRLKRRTAGITKCQQVVAIFQKLFAHAPARPCPYFIFEGQFFQLPVPGGLGIRVSLSWFRS